MAKRVLPPLPQYRSHKIVQAAKITALDHDDEIPSYVLTLDVDPPPGWAKVYVRVSRKWATEKKLIEEGTGKPNKDLGYFVVYEDGYESWSPTKAFEEGYSAVPQAEKPLHSRSSDAPIRAMLDDGRKNDG